jgi:hypothetical protein
MAGSSGKCCLLQHFVTQASQQGEGMHHEATRWIPLMQVYIVAHLGPSFKYEENICLGSTLARNLGTRLPHRRCFFRVFFLRQLFFGPVSGHPC